MALDSTYLVAGQVARGADVKQFYNLFTGAMTDQPVLFQNRLTLSRPAAATPSILNYLLVTGINDTAVNAEANDVYLNLNRTLQFIAASVPALQRAVRIDAPTYSATGAAVLAHATTLGVSGPPVAGTNLTLTTVSAIFAVTGYIRVDETTGGFAYGLGSTAPLDIAGAGSPEGVRTAAPGSVYRDRTNGVIYVKSTAGGVANTGWLLMGTTTVKSIQRGTITLTSAGAVTQADATITTVDTTKTIVNLLGTEGANSINSIIARIKLLNATTIRANRNATSGDTIVSYEAVEFF